MLIDPPIVKFNGRFETSDEVSRRKLQVTTGIFKTIQIYDRVDAQGARERKTVFRVAPAAAIKVGNLDGIKVSAQVGLSSSKKYVSHTLFTGGHLEASTEFLEYLRSQRTQH